MASGKNVMEKVDMKAEFAKMSPTDQHFVKKAEQLTFNRAMAQKTLSRKNYRVAGGLVLLAAVIYGYSIRSVRQEKFLDEYDEMHKK